VYSTCLFCNSALGRNEALATFQVGRRLAYDASRGRLWVICRRCERWNLTPFEERWEAIEEAERLFRATRLRLMTDNVGLARLREGLELVRIGRPLPVELACWRYARVFGQRRRRTLGHGALGLGLVAGSFAWLAGGLVSTAILGGAMMINIGVLARISLPRGRAVVPDGADGRLGLQWVDLASAALTRVPEVGDWSLSLRREDPPDVGDEDVLWLQRLFSPARTLTLRSNQARRALGSIFTAVNAEGGSQRRVREAGDIVAGHRSSHQLFFAAAGATRRRTSPNKLTRLPPPMRLALEMALHEDDERRAMEGELASLEQRWREAEEIATIADSLGVANGIMTRLERLRAKVLPSGAGGQRRG
jgi:hypothetical protein